jgi:hypothetical protein
MHRSLVSKRLISPISLFCTVKMFRATIAGTQRPTPTSSACFSDTGRITLPWSKASTPTKAAPLWRTSPRCSVLPNFKLGEHQFLAMFERKGMTPDATNRHFGIRVRDNAQIAAVREKLAGKYGLKLIDGFRCDFRDPSVNNSAAVSETVKSRRHGVASLPASGRSSPRVVVKQISPKLTNLGPYQSRQSRVAKLISPETE